MRVQRAERIQRNRDMLQQLGVQQAAAAAAAAALPPRAASHPKPGETAAHKRRAPPPEALEPTRRSARARGAEPGASVGPGEGENAMAGSPGAQLSRRHNTARAHDNSSQHRMPCSITCLCHGELSVINYQLHGSASDSVEPGVAASLNTISQQDQAVHLRELLPASKAERTELMELEAYFRWRGQDVSDAIRVDGRYRGCTLRSLAEREALQHSAWQIFP